MMKILHIIVLLVTFLISVSVECDAQKLNFKMEHLNMYVTVVDSIISYSENCTAENIYVEKNMCGISSSDCIFDDCLPKTNLKPTFVKGNAVAKKARFTKEAMTFFNSRYKGTPVGKNIFADPEVYSVEFVPVAQLYADSDDLYICGYFNYYNKYVPGGECFVAKFSADGKLLSLKFGTGYTM